MRIQLLVLDGVFDTGLAVLRDAFATAQELASLQGLRSVHFDVRLAGLRQQVRSAQGLKIPVERRWEPSDWTVVPALGTKLPEALLAALARPDVRDAAVALRTEHEAGRCLAAACIGTFVLAESGALDGEASTTTWWLAPLFHQRYPQVRLDQSRMLLRSGNLVTAGAALSHLDLALYLIRQESPTLADLTAKYLAVDPRPAQSAYILSDHLMHADPLVARFEQWVRAHLAEGFSLDRAASALATSKRTLARRLQAVLGRTPLDYVQDVRVERAVHLLKTGEADLEAIAAQVGYADGVTLRTLLRRKLGHGVRELKRSER